MSALYGFGLGVVSTNAQGATLDAFYPRPLTHVNGDVAGVLEGVAGKLDVAQLKALANALAQVGDTGLADLATKLINTDQPVVATPLTDNAPPASVEEAYLKLHLISHRLVKPHQTDLAGLFGLLPNVAWTDQGPVDLQELSQRQLDARLKIGRAHV